MSRIVFVDCGVLNCFKNCKILIEIYLASHLADLEVHNPVEMQQLINSIFEFFIQGYWLLIERYDESHRDIFNSHKLEKADLGIARMKITEFLKINDSFLLDNYSESTVSRFFEDHLFFK